jgi:Icc protein
MTVLVQLSDIHVASGRSAQMSTRDTYGVLGSALRQLQLSPINVDAILLTGDLVDDGSREGYERIISLVSTVRCPVFVLPGNHDDATVLRSSFGNQQTKHAGSSDFAVDIGDLRLIGLDTSRRGEDRGFLDAVQLEWLANELERHTRQPTLLAMHHPPFPIGVAAMDGIMLDEKSSAALGDLVDDQPNIHGILCGHVHRAMHRRWRGTIAMTAPSLAPAVVFDVTHDAPLRQSLEPPAFLVHTWTCCRGLLSHVQPVSEFPAPISRRG